MKQEHPGNSMEMCRLAFFERELESGKGTHKASNSWKEAPEGRKIEHECQGRQDYSTSLKHVEIGRARTFQHRIFFRRNGWQDVSPWHDVPLRGPDKWLLNFICTTPKGQWVKYEVAGNEKSTPLRLAKSSKGKPSHFQHNLPWNYGFLPQTFSGSLTDCQEEAWPECIKPPLATIDLGSNPSRKIGDVYLVKPLVALLVAGRSRNATWCIVTIDADDRKADFVDNVRDLERYFPGVLVDIVFWLKNENQLSLGRREVSVSQGGMPATLRTVERVLGSAHSSWKLLREKTKMFQKPLSVLRPLFAHELELMWQRHTQNESTEQIEMSCPTLGKSKASVEAVMLTRSGVIGGEQPKKRASFLDSYHWIPGYSPLPKEHCVARMKRFHTMKFL